MSMTKTAAVLTESDVERISLDCLQPNIARLQHMIDDIKKAEAESGSAWEIGAIYLIRTVTMIDTGRLVAVTDNELVLEDAAWIADTGRFSDALRDSDFNEVEPFPPGRVIVNRKSVIDAVQIGAAPLEQK
jgi:hypothetical protein